MGNKNKLVFRAQGYGGNPTLSDMALVNELFDAIERYPPAIEARELLMQQWIESGLTDAAEDTARELLRIDPSNQEAKAFLSVRQVNGKKSDPKSSRSGGQQSAISPKNGDLEPPKAGPLPRSREGRTAMELELSHGYEKVRARAKLLLQESLLVHDLQQREHIDAPQNNHIPNLKALVEGRVSAVVSVRPPRSARAVARNMEEDPGRGLDTAILDLADMIRWRRSITNSLNSSLGAEKDKDDLREKLMSRVQALIAALPVELQQLPSAAIMHVEHEELERTYVNDQTLLLEPIAEIPRSNFWVSEDGYAWDMDELASCIASHGGVMRNPLSRQMFSEGDVRAIVQHPLGRQLAALQLQQSRLSEGVRPATIDKLDGLSSTLLNDESDDQILSRQAIDDFLAYVATLPLQEQRAIDELRVPAKDSHTGQAFDCTIGEAVRDGKANKICLHKTGDLIGQAAKYLRRQSNIT